MSSDTPAAPVSKKMVWAGRIISGLVVLFMLFDSESYRRVGGFDEELFIGEEVFLSMALKKLGRFKLLGVPIQTSGRKLRMYSGRQILSRSIGIILRGKRGARSRENCEFWYDGRRESAR